MVVQIGQSLPSLVFGDERGSRVGVEELRAGRPAVLFFMRAAGCMVCLRHARTLAGLRRDLDARKVMAVVVVPGDAGEAAAVRRKIGDAVTVMSSGDVAAHRAVGLGQSMLMQHSGTFLVDADGILRVARTATMPTGSFDRRELLDAVERL